jgi:heme/copper-type cytochrome/quinol oxidase subunit 4
MMEKNKQIETSRRVYTWLLGLYPQEHRSEYGAEMVRLFTDQCRSAINQRGRPGLVALWLRTLGDLGKTALIEHLSSPQAKNGLLQATPGMALPWKGVLLVLIPGLVFFISQIGQLTGEDWFFSTLRWASYAFLAPVLIVWWRARKFPVWGLVPLGLAFYALAQQKIFSWLYDTSLLFILPLKRLLQPDRYPLVGDGMLGVPFLTVVLLTILAVIVFRRQKLGRAAGLWQGIYIAIVLSPLFAGLIDMLKGYLSGTKSITLFMFHINPLVFDLVNTYTASLFLILIFLGSLIARRQGQAAMLLLLGYLLPVVLYGTYQTDAFGTTASIPPVWIHTAVFIYRLCIAILAPVWLVRSASRRQTLAAMIPVGIALLSQAGLHIAQSIYWNSQSLYKWSLSDIVGTFSKPMVIIAGFLLALVLYRSHVSAEQENPPADAPVQVTAGA